MSLTEYQHTFLHTLIKPYPRFPMIVEVADCVCNIFHDTFVLATENKLDVSWIDLCNNYVDSLSQADKYIIHNYTYSGDEFVNSVLRENTMNAIFKTLNACGIDILAIQIFNMFHTNITGFIQHNNSLSESGKITLDALVKNHNLLNDQEVIVKLLKDYSSQLMRIIREGPRLRKPILTFRGVKKDYIQELNVPITLKGFQSTSYIPDIAVQFMDCCLYEIIITTDTPCLAIQNAAKIRKEYEILLGINTMALVSDLKPKPFFDTNTLLYTTKGTTFKFDEPETILKQILNPYEDSHLVNVRRLITTPAVVRMDDSKPRGSRKTLKIKRGGNQEIVLENGVIVRPLGRELVEVEKESFRKAYCAFGMKYPTCLE